MKRSGDHPPRTLREAMRAREVTELDMAFISLAVILIIGFVLDWFLGRDQSLGGLLWGWAFALALRFYGVFPWSIGR